jgi:glucan biosynthesis protein C
MITSRRYDLDWLRIIAFTVLVYFHTAIIFIPGGLPLIQNAETSTGLVWFVEISQQFRLALLFFISGVGVGFARRRRTPPEFIKERSRRLLIPMIIGILAIVPPMVYTEKLFLGQFSGNFFQFYPEFFTDGVYPAGNLSWHHFWFIAYLYLFCLLGMTLFDRLADETNRLTKTITRRGRGAGIYSFILHLFVVEISLRAFFPGFRDLIHDWASFSHWFLIFIAGYVVANDEKMLDNAERLRGVSLTIAVLSTTLLFALFYDDGFRFDPNDENIIIKYLGFCAFRMTMVWTCILTCLGFAGRYLRVSSPMLSYLNEAVYPLFILHLTVITVLGYFVVEWNIDLWPKYLFITTATIVIILAIYHFLIRPYAAMRLAFGVKPKPIDSANAAPRAMPPPTSRELVATPDD